MNGFQTLATGTKDKEASSTKPTKPIFLATHSRSCSTAFERVFIGQPKRFKCVHEPFGEAFYYGPERISDDIDFWPSDKLERIGQYRALTFDHVTRNIMECVENNRGKRIFVKDMTYHIVPPMTSNVTEVPSFKRQIELEQQNGLGSPRPNPALLPNTILQQFNFAFLIRDPELSVPSKYRLYLPPIADPRLLTPDRFKDKEIGYREMRMLIEYFFPRHASDDLDTADASGPVVVDASDLLANPEGILRVFCHRLGIEFNTDMLKWASDDKEAQTLFHKFKRCHQDAMLSTGFNMNTADEQRRIKLTGSATATKEEMEREWKERYGDSGAAKIKDTVAACRDHYRWLKKFAIAPEKRDL